MGTRQMLSAAIWRLRRSTRISGGPFFIGASTTVRFAGDGRLLMGKDSHVSGGSRLFIESTARIGDGVFIGHNCTIVAIERLTIGARTRIAENVSVHTEDHDLVHKARLVASAIEIGHDCWIGAGVVITRGVKIGDHAVIGANAVVTKDVDSNSLAAGVPARIVRRLGRPTYRSDNTA